MSSQFSSLHPYVSQRLVKYVVRLLTYLLSYLRDAGNDINFLTSVYTLAAYLPLFSAVHVTPSCLSSFVEVITVRSSEIRRRKSLETCRPADNKCIIFLRF